MSLRPYRVCCALAALALCACQTGPTAREIEEAKQTIDCQHGNERYVIRFAEGEARILMPDESRVILYQVPAGSGFRYMNGSMELRGKGLDAELLRNQSAMRLACKPYEIPKAK
jgi:membrane-bound inhibitor of C-type lysozyme